MGGEDRRIVTVVEPEEGLIDHLTGPMNNRGYLRRRAKDSRLQTGRVNLTHDAVVATHGGPGWRDGHQRLPGPSPPSRRLFLRGLVGEFKHHSLDSLAN